MNYILCDGRRARPARMGDYPVRVIHQTSNVVRIEALSARRRRIFGGMARVSKGKKKASGGKSSLEAQCALGAPLTWLFLAGLRPRRARLRFTKHNNHRTSVTVMLAKNTKSGLDTRAVMGVPFIGPHKDRQ